MSRHARRRSLAVAVVGVAAAALSGPAPVAAPARETRAAAPARLLVQASEFHFALSRRTLSSGPAIVQLVDQGQDPHDLRLVRVDRHGHVVAGAHAIGQTLPGRLGEWRGRLAPGRWKLSCTLPGHAAAGMRAYLRVR